MRSAGGRRLFLFVLLAGIGAFSAFWYATRGSTETIEPDVGGRYIEGIAGSPQRINPLFANQNDVDEGLTALIFAGLTRLDAQGRAFPDLAETWTVTPDGRTYTFTLRPGLLWQDGAPLTADDVVFTYETLRALKSTQPLTAVLRDAQVSGQDPRTVSIVLPRPFAPLPAYLTLGIVPAHLLRDVPASALSEHAFNRAPVGAGPFKLEELTAERATLVVSPAPVHPPAFLQRIELRFYRDEGLLLSALKAKQVNAALLSSVASEDARLLDGRGLVLRQLETSELAYVYFNLQSGAASERRVRQALLYALDRDALLKEVPGAVRVDSLLPQASWAYVPALQRYGFDPKQAALLLDEAGWRLGPGGVRTKGGQELSIVLATNTDPVRAALAKEIEAAWSTVGVRVKVEASGATTLIREVLESRAFDAVLFAGDTGRDPDPFAIWHSSQANSRGLNLAYLKDERFDKLLEEGRASPSPRRQEVYAQLQELFAQEVPAIPLYARSYVYVQPEALRGVQVGFLPDPGARFWQVQEWHLRTR